MGDFSVVSQIGELYTAVNRNNEVTQTTRRELNNNAYSTNQTTSQSSFVISQLLATLADGASIPAINTGRTITINNTSNQDLDLYLTTGTPTPSGPTSIATMPAMTGTYLWAIPDVYQWSGNFTAWGSGAPIGSGATLSEFGFNQIIHGTTYLRDTFDISTVPPGIGISCNNGPRSLCVSTSQSAGYNDQQSHGYNVGMQIIPPTIPPGPPAPPLAQPVTVTCNVVSGDSPQSVGYPNDTATPKQQTGYAYGNYTINITSPTNLP